MSCLCFWSVSEHDIPRFWYIWKIYTFLMKDFDKLLSYIVWGPIPQYLIKRFLWFYFKKHKLNRSFLAEKYGDVTSDPRSACHASSLTWGMEDQLIEPFLSWWDGYGTPATLLRAPPTRYTNCGLGSSVQSRRNETSFESYIWGRWGGSLDSRTQNDRWLVFREHPHPQHHPQSQLITTRDRLILLGH